MFFQKALDHQKPINMSKLIQPCLQLQFTELPNVLEWRRNFSERKKFYAAKTASETVTAMTQKTVTSQQTTKRQQIFVLWEDVLDALMKIAV